MSTPGQVIGAPQQESMDGVGKVTETVRFGWSKVQLNDAKAYALSLPPEKHDAKAMSGCYCARLPGSGTPVGMVCHVPCGSGCVWQPGQCWLCFPCFPACIIGVFMCMCEKRDNYWVQQGKGGTDGSYCIPIDAEKGTIAVFPAGPCASNPDEPQCYYSKMC